jgi:hypothetical protein
MPFLLVLILFSRSLLPSKNSLTRNESWTPIANQGLVGTVALAPATALRAIASVLAEGIGAV